MDTSIVSLDIGGTAIKGALFTGAGEIAARDEIPTRHDRGPEYCIDSLCGFVSRLSRGHAVDAVGAGVAGIVDPERTMLLEAPNMPCLRRVPLASLMEERLRCPVILENDANAAALGEWKAGAGRGLENFLFFTLGTGIGAGLIMNACLWRGEQGRAGEFGHITVYPDGEPCGCGKRGCLEAHSSGTAIVRMALAALRQGIDTALRPHAVTPSGLTPERVYECALAGDSVCREVFASMARGLAIAIADVHNLLDICTFIAGGGVSRAYDLFCPMVMEEIDQRVFTSSRGRVRLLKAELGNNAGVYGAFYAARDVLTRR